MNPPNRSPNKRSFHIELGYFPPLKAIKHSLSPSPTEAQSDVRTPSSPQFRASRSTRSGRPTADTDFLDGLPIRQWRKQESCVGAPSSLNPDAPDGGMQPGQVPSQGGWPNWGLPKGMHMYAPWCQQLLRAARAGKTVRTAEGARAPEQRTEEKEGGNADEGAGDTGAGGFTAKRWAPLPRHMEEPEREYLAKRRKGLSMTIVGPGGVVATAPAGAVATDGAGSLEVAAGVGEEEQARRRPPQARRKPKPKRGPGRGRKKVTATEGEGVSASAEAFAASQNHENQVDGAAERAEQGKREGDGEAGEGPHDEEGEDDEEEEGEEGDDDEHNEVEEDDDREEGEITPTKEDAPDRGDASALLSEFKGRDDGASELLPHSRGPAEEQAQQRRVGDKDGLASGASKSRADPWDPNADSNGRYE